MLFASVYVQWGYMHTCARRKEGEGGGGGGGRIDGKDTQSCRLCGSKKGRKGIGNGRVTGWKGCPVEERGKRRKSKQNAKCN
mmetsp:Transcript_963/g.1964  ORF Transcript_963/g.1964 Transcript_963/m.1964 type:complete len:82 (+) Transcript_963:1315-1560(+)